MGARRVTRPKVESPCWFLDENHQRCQGIVVEHISWRGKSLTVIDCGENDEFEIVVRPTHLVACSADAPIGFASVRDDEDAYAMEAILDLVMDHRQRA